MPRPGRLVAASALLAVAVAIAVLLLVGHGGSSDARPPRSAAGPKSGTKRAPKVTTAAASAPEETAPEPESAARARLAARLRRGVEAAAAEGGTAEAAIMLDGWSEPVIVTSERHGEERLMRLWSMSKVATMIAVLQGLGWGTKPGRPISPELDEAFHGAILRSENCRQHRVVLELQRLAGGTGGAGEAFERVFREAGAEVKVATQIAPPEENCLEYLESQDELPEPLAPALLLGTSTWRIGDAVRLVHALALGTYGAAISEAVLGLMRQPKLPSREVPAGELTAPLDWGAGESLPPGTAYKAGWGGSMNGNFLAGQIAVTDLPGIGHAALAAAFHPDEQPPSDDPGITRAPAALDDIFSSLEEER